MAAGHAYYFSLPATKCSHQAPDCVMAVKLHIDRQPAGPKSLPLARWLLGAGCSKARAPRPAQRVMRLVEPMEVPPYLRANKAIECKQIGVNQHLTPAVQAFSR